MQSEEGFVITGPILQEAGDEGGNVVPGQEMLDNSKGTQDVQVNEDRT